MTPFLYCEIHDACFFAARTDASLMDDSLVLQPTPALVSPPTFPDRILLSNSPTRASDLTSAAGSPSCSMIRNHLCSQHFKPVHKPSYAKFQHYSYPFVLANLPLLLEPLRTRQSSIVTRTLLCSPTRTLLLSQHFYHYSNLSALTKVPSVYQPQLSIFYHAGCRNSSAATERMSFIRRRPAPLL